MRRRLVSKKARTVQMQVAEEFYNSIEEERKRFEKKCGIRGIKTTTFTRLLAKNFPNKIIIRRKIVKKQKS